MSVKSYLRSIILLVSLTFLLITPISASAESPDYGDSWSSAHVIGDTQIGYSTSYHSANLHYVFLGRDIDYFRFWGHKGVRYTIRKYSGFNIQTRLYSISGSTLTQRGYSSGSSYKYIYYTPTVSGYHYVSLVVPSVFDTTGSYRIRIYGDDHSDSRNSSATNLSLNTTTYGAIEEQGDSDYFKLTLIKGTAYRFDLYNSGHTSHDLSDPKMYIYNYGGTQVAFDDDSGSGYNSQIYYAPPSSGTYYVKAMSFSTSTVGSYSLYARTVTDDHDNFVDSSATLFSSTYVNAGTSRSGNVQYKGDVDVFRFTATAGEKYSIKTTRGSLSRSYVTIYDNLKRVVNANSGTNNTKEYILTAASSGTYYVSVKSYNSSYSGTYTVRVWKDDHKNYYNSTATSIATTGSSLLGNLQYTSDNDVFKFTATGGKRYYIRASLLTLGRSHLSVLSSSGYQYAYDNSTGTNDIIFTAPSSRTYYVRVRGYTSGYLGTYRVSVYNDITRPSVTILTGPTGTLTSTNNATFTYTGSDNKTLTSNLRYSYKLTGHDTVYSAFSTTTAKAYFNLSNGSYTFNVRSRDESGNISTATATRSFTIAQSTFYRDADGDGYGNPDISIQAGTAPPGYVADNTDCDDTDADVHPGLIWYADVDGDGYSDGTTNSTSCGRPTGYKLAGELTATSGDCNDGVASIHTGATETADDGIDQNCSGSDLITYYRDADGDGYGDALTTTQNDGAAPTGYVADNTDCDDTDANEHSGQTWYADVDGDGYSDGTTDTSSCERPIGYKLATELTATSGDCNDSVASIHTGATETADDGIDQNCSGSDLITYYRDADGDGYGDALTTTQNDGAAQTGYVTSSDDCDDTDNTVYPGATEIAGDGIDQDCNGSDLNQIPVADAGPNQLLSVIGVTVQLDGSNSFDLDNADTLTYQWVIQSTPPGSTATLNDPALESPTFVADIVGPYSVQLTVSDGKDSDSDIVLVGFNNLPPEADAGTDQAAVLGDVINLDGLASTDANGDTLTYAWTLVSAPAGSAAAITVPSAGYADFTPDIKGDYVVSLVVNDGALDSPADIITVSVYLVDHHIAKAMLIETIADLRDLKALTPEVYLKKRSARILIVKIKRALRYIKRKKAGPKKIRRAINKLNIMLRKIDGCALRGVADPKKYDDLGNLVVKDHIVDCTAQTAIYDNIQEAIDFLEDMLLTP